MIYDWRTDQDAVQIILRSKAKQTVSSITAAIWEFFGDPWYGKAKQTFVATTKGAWELFGDFWGGAAYNLYTAPVIASTIDSKHIRLWNYSKPMGRRFGGYSKR
jgi:hypothetical protein